MQLPIQPPLDRAGDRRRQQQIRMLLRSQPRFQFGGGRSVVGIFFVFPRVVAVGVVGAVAVGVLICARRVERGTGAAGRLLLLLLLLLMLEEIFRDRVGFFEEKVGRAGGIGDEAGDGFFSSSAGAFFVDFGLLLAGGVVVGMGMAFSGGGGVGGRDVWMGVGGGVVSVEEGGVVFAVGGGWGLDGGGHGGACELFCLQLRQSANRV
mmetsp:Transcript_11023/g.22450  ORF Transcript_11023/g.22450 Transcript_11023/m.22450 type:complete len:207 (-) Transcript_11023:19-639(-)